MFKWQIVHTHYGRTPWRNMRKSHRWPSSRIEGHSRKILLASHKGRLLKLRTAVQAVPTTCWLAQGASKRAQIDLQPMAVPYLGDRYSEAIPFSVTIDDVPCDCNRIFHKVDRAWASSTDHNPQDPALCVEEHSMSFWSPKTVGVW